jgi:hypothetical protein
MKKHSLVAIALAMLASPSYAQGPTIPFALYKVKDAQGTTFVTTNTGIKQLGWFDSDGGNSTEFSSFDIPIEEIPMDITIGALTVAVNAAKAVACPSVGNGDVSISFTVDGGGELILNLGVGAGITIGFECKDGKPV